MQFGRVTDCCRLQNAEPAGIEYQCHVWIMGCIYSLRVKERVRGVGSWRRLTPGKIFSAGLSCYLILKTPWLLFNTTHSIWPHILRACLFFTANMLLVTERAELNHPYMCVKNTIARSDYRSANRPAYSLHGVICTKLSVWYHSVNTRPLNRCGSDTWVHAAAATTVASVTTAPGPGRQLLQWWKQGQGRGTCIDKQNNWLMMKRGRQTAFNVSYFIVWWCKY